LSSPLSLSIGALIAESAGWLFINAVNNDRFFFLSRLVSHVFSAFGWAVGVFFFFTPFSSSPPFE